jgi:hypothetical protein
MGFAVGGSFVAAYLMSPAQHESRAASEHDAANQNSKEKSDEALARYTWWLTLFTGVLAFATVGLGIATVGLYVAGEKQIKITERAANAADLSARVAIAIQLPVLRVEPVGFSWGRSQDGDNPETEYFGLQCFDITNLGRTDAFPVEIRWGWFVGDKLPDIPIYVYRKPFQIDAIIRLEHVVFFRNRDSQRGGFLIQTRCWVMGASMDDATLFGGHSRTRSCKG